MIDEKAIKAVAEAIAAERVKQFGAAAGLAPREVEFEYARVAILAYESAKPKEAEGWRDITSAPKDGTVFQAWHTVHGCPMSILWNKDGFIFGGERMNWVERSYTTAWPERCLSHWRPLPEPPSAMLSAAGDGK